MHLTTVVLKLVEATDWHHFILVSLIVGAELKPGNPYIKYYIFLRIVYCFTDL